MKYILNLILILCSISLSAQVTIIQSAGFLNPSGGGTSNFLRADGTWAVPPGSGGSPTLNSIAAATSTASVNHGANQIDWSWNSLTTLAGLTFNSSSLTTGSIITVVNTNNSLNSSTGLFYINNAGTSTSGTTFRVLATNGSIANLGFKVQANGNSGFNVATPTAALHVGGVNNATNIDVTGMLTRFDGGSTNDASTATSGTVTSVAVNAINTPSLSATNTGITYTNASSLYIAGAPAAGTNITITNPYTIFTAQGINAFTGTTATTNASQERLQVKTNLTTGTVAASFGSNIGFYGSSNNAGTPVNDRLMGAINVNWSTATDASRTAKMDLQLVNNAGAITTPVSIAGSGTLSVGLSAAVVIANTSITSGSGFTVGNSAQILTLGGSSGSVTVSTTSGTGGSAIILNPSSTTASSTGNVTFGNSTALTQTSGTRNYIDDIMGFSPTSGTAVNNAFQFSGTYNQTGGANGITRGIYLNQTLTAVADMRLIEIAANGANTKGIYQTGSSVVNNLVGKTFFGSTSTPTALLQIAAGSTSVSPILLTSGSLLTAATGGNIEYDGSYHITKASSLRITVGGPIADFASDANNTSTTETDLFSTTIPVNALATNNDKLIATYAGTFNDVTATAILKIYFAGTVIGTTGTLTISNTGSWQIETTIIRATSTTAKVIVTIMSPSATVVGFTTETDLSSLDFTVSNILKITGQAGGAGGGSSDITAKLGTISWLGAAAN